MSATRTAVLISGSGTNLQAFLDAASEGKLTASIALVVSNRQDAYGLKRADAAGVPGVCIPHGDFASREAFDRRIAAELDDAGIDTIVLAGFMRILSGWFVERYLGKIINIHPALLPKYPGLDTHQRVLDGGDRFHGSTVHFVIQELDAGPSILQGRLSVAPSTDAASLAARVQSIEHRIYPQALDWLATGRLQYCDGKAVLDGAILTAPIVRDFG